jgi:hypothetical protein
MQDWNAIRVQEEHDAWFMRAGADPWKTHNAPRRRSVAMTAHTAIYSMNAAAT